MSKRKKLSEMTPFERVTSRMAKISFDEAEDVGVEILSRVVAVRMYAYSKDEKYLQQLFQRICKRADDFAHNEAALNLAIIKVNIDKINEQEKKQEDKNE